LIVSRRCHPAVAGLPVGRDEGRPGIERRRHPREHGHGTRGARRAVPVSGVPPAGRPPAPTLTPPASAPAHFTRARNSRAVVVDRSRMPVLPGFLTIEGRIAARTRRRG